MLSVCFSYLLRLRATATFRGALLLLIALFVACNNAPAPVVVSETNTPTGRTAPRTSLPMPPTTTTSAASANSQSFTLLNDERVKLSDYTGKVVVLDFWATFCEPCRVEAPHLDALQKRFGEQGLLVIGLNVGGQDDRREIPGFIQELNIKYTLGFPEPEMINLFMGSDDRIPQTLVFDRTGRLVKHFVGYDQTVSSELERTIEEAVMSNE
jgi:thiol-disulfide isomerase/thioredoxin